MRTHLKTHCGEKSNKCNQCAFASERTSGDWCLAGASPNKCNQCEFASSDCLIVWSDLLIVWLAMLLSERTSGDWTEVSGWPRRPAWLTATTAPFPSSRFSSGKIHLQPKLGQAGPGPPMRHSTFYFGKLCQNVSFHLDHLGLQERAYSFKPRPWTLQHSALLNSASLNYHVALKVCTEPLFDLHLHSPIPLCHNSRFKLIQYSQAALGNSHNR